MTLSRLLRIRSDEREDGMAMVVVLGVTVMLSALIVAGIATSTGAARQAQRDESWSASLAAAYAGIEEYESRLANDTGYFAYGNPAAPFTVETGSSGKVALPTGPSANPAFGVGTSGTWATVPGSEGKAEFRYEVDNSRFYIDGTLRVRATGRAGGATGDTRSIVADIKQKGFIDFLYFTDYEVRDPEALNPDDSTNCAIHHYEGARPGCTVIYFGGQDEINGPMHTNDAFQTNGPAKFNGKVTTAYKAATGKNYIKSSGTAPTFKISTDPQNIATIGMPPTNSQLKKETRSDLPNEVPSPGCLYTGPTSITFHADGTMTVVSPWTRFTNTAGVADAVGSSPTHCGVPGNSGLAKRDGTKYVGTKIPVPANLVVYVQNVPSSSGNKNFTSGTKPPFPSSASSCATNSNSIGYPQSGEKVPFSKAYGCRNGDLFVSGTLSGNATLASENYIYVTGDIEYADAAEDMLGLVGNNAVWVWNPVNSSNQPQLTKNRRIDAAILSVGHTFLVQNYDKGSSNRGTLTVNGAIAQKFRGPVGTGSGASMSTGYAKDYNYDERFRYMAPPKFLSPVTTTYGVNVWVEVEPAFEPDGSAS